MTQDDIIRMAREAGFEKTRIYKSKIVRRIDNIGAVERLISIAFAAGVAAERHRMEIDSIHTCHDECQRPACVAGRDARTKAAKAERERCILILETLHNGAGGIHNYFKYAAETLKVSGGER
jgi:hypothetical protein